MMNQRQERQKQFDESGKNLVVGCAEDSPIAPETLAMTTNESDYVIETFQSGLTAEVYHIRVDGRDYTLKKKRQVAKVSNLDGQYSFLNEVQCRATLQSKKNDPQQSHRFTNVVSTVYADYRLGIILSEWIPGGPITELTATLVEQLFTTLINIEQAGLFEWDLSSGNLLVDDNGKLWLFDFGYMYPFSPLREFNNNGLSDPMFHFCERFETRFLSGWFIQQSYSEQQCLSLFQIVKQAACAVLNQKCQWLMNEGAPTELIDQVEQLISTYQDAVSSESKLKQLYHREMFRSHVLDIDDDLSGKSCTETTLKRIEIVQTQIAQDFERLKQGGALFHANANQTKQTLIESYQHKLMLARSYQV